MTPENLLYSDSLVEITEDSICFKDYYFPVGSKEVRFSEIDTITEKKPTWWNGKYRVQGTGDLQTWFPKDWHRPSRSKLFFAHLRGSSRCIGFTVENAGLVEQILRGKSLLT
ncbi:MAG: hypothetical protein ACRYFS_12395 [Janthinobacterium lividum]